jgi:hypothetical protein
MAQGTGGPALQGQIGPPPLFRKRAEGGFGTSHKGERPKLRSGFFSVSLHPHGQGEKNFPRPPWAGWGVVCRGYGGMPGSGQSLAAGPGQAIQQLTSRGPQGEAGGGTTTTGASGQAIRCSCCPVPWAMGSPVVGWWIGSGSGIGAQQGQALGGGRGPACPGDRWASRMGRLRPSLPLLPVDPSSLHKPSRSVPIDHPGVLGWCVDGDPEILVTTRRQQLFTDLQ